MGGIKNDNGTVLIENIIVLLNITVLCKSHPTSVASLHMNIQVITSPIEM